MSSHQSLLMSLPPTRFRFVDRRTALAVLIAIAVAFAALQAIATVYVPPPGATSAEKGDLALYARIVERMRTGEGYYPAAHAELVAGGYGTRSVFNWRPPVLPWLASLVGPGAADIVLRLVAVAAAIAAAAAIGFRASWTTAAIAVPVLSWNLVAAAAPNAALFSDIVAGVLLLASVAAYGLRVPLIGVALALAALFMRELVAPFVLVCVYLAWQNRRWSELWTWTGGLAAFAVYFAWHAFNVHAAIGPDDIAYTDGWVQFGGLEFLLGTATFNGLSIAMPLWWTAMLLPLCLLGLAAWNDEMGKRTALAVAVYLAIFMIVGKPVNTYWGAFYTPMMMLGLAFAPAAFRDLTLALRRTGAPAGA